MPQKLQMGAYQIDVSLSPELQKKWGAIGVMLQERGSQYSIVMHESIPDEALVSILIHELIEAANNMYGLELEHMQIQTLECALFQGLPDSAKDAMAKWIAQARKTPAEEIEEPTAKYCHVEIVELG